jgi:hypothetical protein
MFTQLNNREFETLGVAGIEAAPGIFFAVFSLKRVGMNGKRAGRLVSGPP